MIVVGLTGAIGVGKSTVAGLFLEMGGIALYDADSEIHKLYCEEEMIKKIESVFPQVINHGIIDHRRLATVVFESSRKLRLLEKIVYPQVRKREKEFLYKARKDGKKIAVLDIPLLLEKGGKDRVDIVVVVIAPFFLQKERVLRRPGMTEEKFLKILSHQMDEEERRKKADFILDSSSPFDQMRADIHVLVTKILERHINMMLIRKEGKVDHA